MALITCNECGKEFSENADKCPNCGNPNPNQKNVTVVVEKPKGVWSTGRLTLGIISIVLFLLIALQSCAAGVSNALQENGATSGSSGLVCAIMYLVGGIVSIASRNAKGIGGSVACVILYLFGFFAAMPGADTYGDLSVWGGLCVILAIFHLVCAVKTKKKE